jgi:hypothetical protein
MDRHGDKKRFHLECRGGWKSAQPLGIVSMDVSKFDFESRRTCGKTAQMDV